MMMKAARSAESRSREADERFFCGGRVYGEASAGDGKVGITGFCYGGGVSNAAAVAIPELACAVPFYGRQPPLKEVDKIKAPLLLHYAGWIAALMKAGPPMNRR
jgi:carboxymethylenebutenolidase